jgi:hypothetical protein
MDRDAAAASRLIDGLVAEGLVARLGDELRAP